MEPGAISRYITSTYADVEPFEANGTTFFFLDPEQKFPFATLVTNDYNDTASDLERPAAYRLNLGVSRETRERLFGAGPLDSEAYDFTAYDRIMPHPVYGKMHWICVLNPSPETFERKVIPLIAEAYERDRAKHGRRAAS